MKSFYSQLLRPLKQFAEGEICVENVREALSTINRYFYTSTPDIGQLEVEALDFTTPYFSEFHKLWDRSAEDIIGPSMENQRCGEAARVLHNVRSTRGDGPFGSAANMLGLEPEALAQVRFLTANQDFRGSRDTEKFFRLYSQDPTVFDLRNVSTNPAGFLTAIGITKLSQNDKREKFAKTAADFLLQRDIAAVDLAGCFDNHAARLKEALTTTSGMGYGNKKADMFIRDMHVWRVWPNLSNLSVLDVPSDVNTVKVALRSGILRTKLTPLVSSFLDIFCYQYSIIDNWAARAWRRVWEIWQSDYADTAPYGPVFMDHFLYKIIGRAFCKESLYQYVGEDCGHSVYWHSANMRNCVECLRSYRDSSVSYECVGEKVVAQCQKHTNHRYEVENRRSKRCRICESTDLSRAKAVSRYLPCTHEHGYISIRESEYVRATDACLAGISECPFAAVCRPKSGDFRKLNPPKSISILGRTGWESARADAVEGGGGLMS